MCGTSSRQPRHPLPILRELRLGHSDESASCQAQTVMGPNRPALRTDFSAIRRRDRASGLASHKTDGSRLRRWTLRLRKSLLIFGLALAPLFFGNCARADYPAVASTSTVPTSDAYQNWCGTSGVANMCTFYSVEDACSFDAYYWGATGSISALAQAGSFVGEYAEVGLGANPTYSCMSTVTQGGITTTAVTGTAAPRSWPPQPGCPAGFTQSGDTCTGTTYSCPSGGTLQGTTCVTGSNRNGGQAGSNGKDPGSPCNGVLVGHPINIATGNKYLSETDFVGAPERFRWARHYNSQFALQTPANSLVQSQPALMSSHWTHSYSRTIQLQSSTAANVIRADGSVRVATPVGSPVTSGQQPWALDSTSAEQLFEQFDANASPIGWTLYDPGEQVVETYNASGSLLAIESLTGRTQRIQYSDGTVAGGVILDPDGNPSATGAPLSAGLQTKVTDDFGHTMQMGYDGFSRLVKLTDPAGNAFLYGYDGADNLTWVVFPDASFRQYRYNENALLAAPPLPNALTGIITENGTRLASYSYDSLGRATSSTWWADAAQTRPVDSTAVAYLSASQSNVTDGLGTVRTYGLLAINQLKLASSISQPAGAGCSASSSVMTYDANANVTSRADYNGNLTCSAFDTTRNVETARIEGISASGSCPSSVAGYVPATGTVQRKIQTLWHPVWKLATQRAEPLKITTWVYNGQVDPTVGGNALSCAPGNAVVNGQPIAVLCRRIEQATTDASGALGFSATASGLPRIWNYTYNTFGQVLTLDGPRTDVADITTFQYYAATDTAHSPPLYWAGDLQQIQDALGHVTQFPSYDAFGRPLQVVDPNGTTTSLQYTPRGWLASKTVQAPAGGASETTLYSYDPTGQLLAITMPDGTSIGFAYDEAKRITQLFDSQGDTITYTLDAVGNRTLEQTKDPSGNLTRQISRVYDALSRLQQITGGLQ
jgi:YD repeat-containing protein